MKKKKKELYYKRFNRKNNFISKLSAKRIARKALAGLWIKMSNFEQDRCMNNVYSRIKARDKRKFIKWAFKDKNYPKRKIPKIHYFFNLYTKKRNPNDNKC